MESCCRVADCKVLQGQRDKAPTLLQDSKSLAKMYALPDNVKHDVAANTSGPAYKLTSYADLQTILGGQCSVDPSAVSSAVQSCTIAKNNSCCVRSEPNMVRHAATSGACDCQSLLCCAHHHVTSSSFHLHIHTNVIFNLTEFIACNIDLALQTHHVHMPLVWCKGLHNVLPPLRNARA